MNWIVVPEIVLPKGRRLMKTEQDVNYAWKYRDESEMQLEGRLRLEHYRDGVCLFDEWDPTPNIVTTVGLNHFLDVVLGATAKSATWYVFIFKNNVTPAAGDTAAAKLGAAGTYGECQDADYDLPLTNRPEYIDVPAAAGVMTNAASKAQFTIAATITVYGAGIVDVAAKTGTTGTLAAAKKFTTSRAVVDNDELFVTYQVTGTSS